MEGVLFFCRRSPRAGGWTTPIGRLALKQSGHRWVGLMKGQYQRYQYEKEDVVVCSSIIGIINLL